MLKLKNEKLPVEIDGQLFQLTKPKNKDVEKLMALSKSNEDDQLKSSLDFLVDSGLPREVVNNLDLDLTTAIMEYLMPEKKS